MKTIRIEKFDDIFEQADMKFVLIGSKYCHKCKMVKKNIEEIENNKCFYVDICDCDAIIEGLAVKSLPILLKIYSDYQYGVVANAEVMNKTVLQYVIIGAKND